MHGESHGEGNQHYKGHICGKGREPAGVIRPLRASSTVTVFRTDYFLKDYNVEPIENVLARPLLLDPLMQLSDLRRFGRVSSAEAVKGTRPRSARGNRKP